MYLVVCTVAVPSALPKPPCSVNVSPKQYYTHHMQQISKAAVVYDAMAIRKQLLGLRQRLCVNVAAHAAPAAGDRA